MKTVEVKEKINFFTERTTEIHSISIESGTTNIEYLDIAGEVTGDSYRSFGISLELSDIIALSVEKKTESVPKDKMALKHKVETVITVKYKDLNKFIKEIYDVDDYSFLKDYKCSQDSTHELTVQKEKLDDHDKNQLEKWKETGYSYFLTDTMLIDLCNKDLVLPGTYIIDTSW